MRAKCSSKTNEQFPDFSDLFKGLFSEERIRKMKEPLAEKSEQELEFNIQTALLQREVAIKELCKNLCVLRGKMSDYRFKKLLARRGINPDWAKTAIEAGTELLHGGK